MDQVAPDTSPSTVLADPARFRGRAILVAGHILRTETRPDGSLIEILGYPPTSHGFPDTSEPALGRFALLYSEPLDPLIYQPGRQVSAVGRVVGQRSVMIGQAERLEPLLNTIELRLLPEPTFYTPISLGVGFTFGF